MLVPVARAAGGVVAASSPALRRLSACHVPQHHQDAQEEGQLGRRRRINLQTNKCNQKDKGEQRENKLKWLTKKLKDLPAENGETKHEESPAYDEAGEKEAKSG